MEPGLIDGIRFVSHISGLLTGFGIYSRKDNKVYEANYKIRKNNSLVVEDKFRGSNNYDTHQLIKEKYIQMIPGDILDITMDLPASNRYYFGYSMMNYTEIPENEKPIPFEGLTSPYNKDPDGTLNMGQIPFITYCQF